MLGVSLVSLLRGTCGPWPQVRAAQQEYVQRTDALIGREAAQLQFLAEVGHPRVCPVAGVRRGVLFTESVTGASLAHLLLNRPQHSAELLAGTFGELRAARPGPETGKHLMHGIGDLAAARMGGLPVKARRAWLRELLALWLMDSVNILTTYLSAPAELPLPAQGTALADRAVEVCRMVEQISTDLAAAGDTGAVWDSALGHAQAVAA
ncbi:hypothetical protein JK363_33795 [Streptomyces sp. 205]|uniref:Uncharacterized protein n=1 Tax=Streptomyces coffeae TaxID=621382 RepID=A0ABS1NN73_9ACTN|nr:hypothetical protein [Streptomyces coffeae]